MMIERLLRAKQAGLSLVELMIAIAIGLVVSLVATTAYISGLKIQQTDTDLSRLEESGRFGFMLLANEIKKAGFHDNWSSGSYIGGVFGSDSSAGSVVDGQAGTAASVNFSDSLTVSFYGENNFSDPPTVDNADGRVLDCLGNAISRTMRVSETIHVALDPLNDNEPTLYCDVTYFPGSQPGHSVAPACAGAGATCSSALIPGVEAMKIVYGEDTDGDGIVNRYVAIDNVGDKDNILSAMVSLVVRTPGPTSNVNLDTTAKTITHFGSTALATAFTPPVDGRFRFPFTSTIAVRNFGTGAWK